MIKVILDYAGENLTGFKVEGHSGYAPSGEDICCAGVSAITQTALAGLHRHIHPELQYKKSPGYLECRLPQGLNADENQKAQIILSTMAEGILLLEKEYREYIHVVIRR